MGFRFEINIRMNYSYHSSFLSLLSTICIFVSMHLLKLDLHMNGPTFVECLLSKGPINFIFRFHMYVYSLHIFVLSIVYLSSFRIKIRMKFCSFLWISQFMRRLYFIIKSLFIWIFECNDRAFNLCASVCTFTILLGRFWNDAYTQ